MKRSKKKLVVTLLDAALGEKLERSMSIVPIYPFSVRRLPPEGMNDLLSTTHIRDKQITRRYVHGTCGT